MEHEHDPDVDEPYVPPAGNVLEGEVDSQSPAEQPTLGDTAEGQGVVGFLGAAEALIMYWGMPDTSINVIKWWAMYILVYLSQTEFIKVKHPQENVALRNTIT